MKDSLDESDYGVVYRDSVVKTADSSQEQEIFASGTKLLRTSMMFSVKQQNIPMSRAIRCSYSRIKIS